MSSKRKEENVERARLMRETFGERETWKCSLRNDPTALTLLGVCFGDVNGHEIVKRSQGGSITDMRNIILLCNQHNCAIEDSPVSAHKLGLTKHGWEV